MKHLPLLTLTLVMSVAAVTLPSADADARGRRTSQIPNDPNNPCDACHIFPGGPRTPFGLQVDATMTAPGSAGNAQWSEVFNLDADGDGYTNGQEMGDTLGTWLTGDPNPGFLSDPNSVDSVPDGLTPLCTPGAEAVCDGVDNNCDGNIDEGLDCTPTVGSFAADRATVQADGIELQTLRVALNSGQSVDEVRLIINHPWHTENGREFDGYFRVGPGLCNEVGAGLGNDKVAIDNCQINDNPDGSREFVVSYTIDPSFGAATDHVVSALWFSGGTALSTWNKLTAPGNGFATTVDPGFTPPASLNAFNFDKASVTANGADAQTFSLSFNNGADLTEVLVIINHPWHTENAREFDGYFSLTPGGCTERGAGLGNDTVTLDTGNCTVTTNGSITTFTFPVLFEGTFGAATDHVVSTLWFEEGVAANTWTKLTTTGNGFDTIADPNFTPAPSFNSFAFDQSTIANDDVEVQTFRVRFDNADDITELLVFVNHPWHTENGSIGDGYFRVGPGLCNEVGAGSGNDTVTLITDACQISDLGGGVTEFSLNFTANNSFLASTNHAVSILWYENDAPASTWTKVTTTGNGFDVTASQSPPSSINAFSFDQAAVANDDVEVQTFRLRLNDADNVTEAFFIINHPWHTENGREYDGYFRVGPGLCNEVGAGLGNDRVALITDACQINDLGGGVTEFVLNFTVNDGYPAIANNTVSTYWKEGDAVIRTWTKLTTTGNGFDVTEPQTDPSTLNGFSFDQASVANDNAAVQTFRVRFNDADNVTEVFLLINHPWHTENGREYDGYFRVGPGLCNEVGAGLGNDRVALITDACQINDLGGGVTEFVLNFTVNDGYPAIANNTVSTYWKEGDAVIRTWTKLTTTGNGFDVTAP